MTNELRGVEAARDEKIERHRAAVQAVLATMCERHGIPYDECIEAEDVETIVRAYLEATAPVMAGAKVKPLNKTQIETLANNIHNVDDFAYTVECLTHHLSEAVQPKAGDNAEVEVVAPLSHLGGIHIAGWINEDELPESYPYDVMYPHSKVDGVRLFPIFAPDETPSARTGLLREALARMENCFEYLASTRTHEIYTAMIDGGQTQALLDLDAARRNARDVLSATAAEASPVCQTCNDTGKEGRHSICRDCDETPTPACPPPLPHPMRSRNHD
jgi:hypothetical protein